VKDYQNLKRDGPKKDAQPRLEKKGGVKKDIGAEHLLGKGGYMPLLRGL